MKKFTRQDIVILHQTATSNPPINVPNFMRRFQKIVLRLLVVLIVIFCIINIIAFLHAYRFTHFDKSAYKTSDSGRMSISQKVKIIIFGVNNPRPQNTTLPERHFEKVIIKSNLNIECWYIKTDSHKGTVILFHGYAGKKSSLLDKANIFLELGYNALLVDFMGSGGSDGNQTTIGFREAEEVKSCFEYVQRLEETNIILFGTSMGAVAIMKSISDYSVTPKAIIIECPFGSMLKTVQNRFSIMGIPNFPLANLLVFWGGIQNGFNGFNHNPYEYAKQINCPTLLLYGQMDNKVSRSEIDEIYANLRGKKDSVIYPLAGHENYLSKYKEKWSSDIAKFLSSTIKV